MISIFFNRRFAFATVVAILLSSGCFDKSVEGQVGATTPQSIDAMLAEADRLNGLCRGGGDEEKTAKACERRDALGTEIEARGWCWGPKNAIGADKRWMPCKDDASDALTSAAESESQQWFFKTSAGRCEQLSVAQAKQSLVIRGHGDVKTKSSGKGGIQVYVDIPGGNQIIFDLQPECEVDSVALASLSEAKDAIEEKKYSLAFELLKPLADQGNSEAQAYLGVMYEFGQGVALDLKEAFRWYLAAADQGSAWAQANLGLLYANGRGIAKDDKEAVRWFRAAAMQGRMKAQEALGSMYNQGRLSSLNGKDVVKLINASNSLYIQKLERDYRNRISFESSKAERIVRGFDIDCKASRGNGHYLPLINVLYSRLASADKKEMWLETSVQERDGEVRIYDVLRTPKEVLHTIAVFQINKWGELESMGSVRLEAVRNACFNSYGPIWLLE
ncbi:tetratricopeptide repeat protein [Hydrogenophaga soli]